MNTELLSQTIHSVNQVSIYAAVTNGCYKFASKEEETEHILRPVDNRVMAVVEPDEVDDIFSEPGTEKPDDAE